MSFYFTDNFISTGWLQIYHRHNTKYKIQNSNYQCSTHNLVFPAANTHTLYLRFSSILVHPSAEHSFAFLPSAYALMLLYGKYSIAEKKFLVNRALREKKQAVI